MKAIFEIEDDKVSVKIEGGSLSDAVDALLKKILFGSPGKLLQLRTLDQKSRLHIPGQILEAASIPPDSSVLVSYDNILNCVCVRRAE